MHNLARALLVAVALAAAAAPWLASESYETQARELPNAPPGAGHPLGTDDLGRDRFSRLLHGARVSLMMAPVSAALATLLGTLAGLGAALGGVAASRFTGFLAGIFLSFPWLFLLMTVRSALPLNTDPWVSVLVSFLLMGLLGWAAGARVVEAGARRALDSAFVLSARAQGLAPSRIFFRHLVPAVRPLMGAQFWAMLPVFIATEATLGLLGLGVAEPLPSLGGLLAELQNLPAVAESPWITAPAGLLVTVLVCLRVAIPRTENS